MKPSDTSWVFFGTSSFSVIILEELKSSGFIPKLIVTVPDKPKGRKLILTPPETKVWAEKVASSATRREGGKIPVIQPKSLRTPEIVEEIQKYSPQGFDVFIVASYGKLIPEAILNIPNRGVLNVHPSLLPKFRGASPIQSAILKDGETGVTIIRLDTEMDHGPIITQEKISMIDWPPYESDLEKALGEIGGKLLAKVLPEWIDGKIKEVEQDHAKATLCDKIQKTDAEINLTDDPEINLRKIRAYHIWPGAYFFETNSDGPKRIIVKQAHIENSTLVFDRIIPEGKKEMSYADYLKGKR